LSIIAFCHQAQSFAAMRCGIELSADEILGEPDDQVVVHGHLHAFADWPLAAACAPAVGDIAASSVQPLSRAILVEQGGRGRLPGRLYGLVSCAAES